MSLALPSLGLTAATTGGALVATVYVALLAAGCVTDFRERRIPNRLVLLLLVAGLGYTALAAPARAGLLGALAAMAGGFALWLPFYALRMLGAGDVKFFAAGAAWLAPAQMLHAAFYTALAGGLLSVLWLVLEHGTVFGLARSLQVARQPAAAMGGSHVRGESRRHIPYGIAMAVGLALSVWLPRFL